MNNFVIHDAIRNLYPNVVTIRGEESFDNEDNLIEVDMDEVMIEAERLSNIKPISIDDTIKDLKAQIEELKKLING